MRFPDDAETEQIGKLIDAGHAELATSALRSRWRYKLAIWTMRSIPFAAVAVWHFAR